MSLFQVQLQQGLQGALDKDPSTMYAGNVTGQGLGTPFGFENGSTYVPSRQRQVYVMGPNRINRLLKDGDTFTDCNYWKKFAYPQVSMEKAFILVLHDDGSAYAGDVPGGNTFPVSVQATLAYGATYTLDFVGNTSTNTAVGNYGSPATFCQIENINPSNTSNSIISVTLNGATTSFSLYPGTSQIFNSGDLAISSIVFSNSTSGNTSIPIQVIAAVASGCQS